MPAPEIPEPELLSPKELQSKLRRSSSYVYALKGAMTRAGYLWIAGQTTMDIVMLFLRDHPDFRFQKYRKLVRGEKREAARPRTSNIRH